MNLLEHQPCGSTSGDTSTPTHTSTILPSTPSCAPHITHVAHFTHPRRGVCPSLSWQPPFWLTAQCLRDLHFPVITSSVTHPRRCGSDAGKEQEAGVQTALTHPLRWLAQLIPSLKVPHLAWDQPFHRGPTWLASARKPPETVRKYFIGSLWLWAREFLSAP